MRERERMTHPLSLSSSSLSVLASQLPLSRLWNLCTAHRPHDPSVPPSAPVEQAKTRVQFKDNCR